MFCSPSSATVLLINLICHFSIKSWSVILKVPCLFPSFLRLFVAYGLEGSLSASGVPDGISAAFLPSRAWL